MYFVDFKNMIWNSSVGVFWSEIHVCKHVVFVYVHFYISTMCLYSFFRHEYEKKLFAYVHEKIAYNFQFFVYALRMHVEKRNRGTTKKTYAKTKTRIQTSSFRIRVFTWLYTCNNSRIHAFYIHVTIYVDTMFVYVQYYT